jgi:hypothetical protein
MGDKNMVVMEQVAMYMAALPCPPMPLMVLAPETDTPQKKKAYCNSHDFIASLLLTAMAHGNTKLNEERKAKQVELTEKLLKQMASLKDLNVDQAYTYFSEFTAGYICAFANIDVGVTFLPLHDVEKKDNVHKACCSWNRAQSIILKENTTTNESLEKMTFRDLLLVHCQRFMNNTNDNHESLVEIIG